MRTMKPTNTAEQCLEYCCMLFAWWFDIVAVFVITALLGCMSLCVLHFIKANDIDDNMACGLNKAQTRN